MHIDTKRFKIIENDLKIAIVCGERGENEKTEIEGSVKKESILKMRMSQDDGRKEITKDCKRAYSSQSTFEIDANACDT